MTTARVTTINSSEPDGTWDYITVTGDDGEDLYVVQVASSEDEEPYIEALREAGWIVTGTDPSQSGVTGADAWVLAKSGLAGKGNGDD